MIIDPTPPTLTMLLEKNKKFVEAYQASPMMKLIKSETMKKENYRDRFLDSIQTLSDYFQKTVLLRSVLCDTPTFKPSIMAHLKEEFGHNEQLLEERNHKAPTWDPILEAVCSWFTWKMFTANNEEKIVLIHLVLEASGNVFFRIAQPIIQEHMHIDYFKIHAEADEEHEKMGLELLQDLSPKQYAQLIIIQSQGWSMFMTISERIAMLQNYLHAPDTVLVSDDACCYV